MTKSNLKGKQGRLSRTAFYSLSHLPAARLAIKTIALLITLTFIFPYLAWAFEKQTFLANTSGIRFNQDLVFIPKKLGTVAQSFQGQEQLIIHIQDLHCNQEVQLNIAGILDHLSNQFGLRLVAVEGAAQPVRVDKLSTFPVTSVKKEVGRYFIKEGKVTGPEYFAATTPRAIHLEGIENPDFYRASREKVLGFLNDESQGYVFDLRNTLEALKPRIYAKALSAHDHFRSEFMAGQRSLLSYCAYLYQAGRKANISLEAFTQLKTYVSLRRQVFPLEVDSDQLYQEIERLERYLRQNLYTTEAEQELDSLQHRLEVVEKLLSIAATPEELKEYWQYQVMFKVRNFVEFISRHDPAGDLELDPEVFQLDAYLEQVKEFYQLADQRSLAFVENTLARMRDRDARLAVLVTGGFHTGLILETLRKQGISYMSVKPRVSRFDTINPYFALLRERKTPLEKLLAQNQDILALLTAFPQGDPKLAAQENVQPGQVRIFLKLLDLTLKEGLIANLIQRGVHEFEDLAGEYTEVVSTWEKNNARIVVDWEGALANIAVQTYLLPVLNNGFTLVIQPRDAEKCPGKVLLTRTVSKDYKVTVLHNINEEQRAALLGTRDELLTKELAWKALQRSPLAALVESGSKTMAQGPVLKRIGDYISNGFYAVLRWFEEFEFSYSSLSFAVLPDIGNLANSLLGNGQALFSGTEMSVLRIGFALAAITILVLRVSGYSPLIKGTKRRRKNINWNKPMPRRRMPVDDEVLNLAEGNIKAGQKNPEILFAKCNSRLRALIKSYHETYQRYQIGAAAKRLAYELSRLKDDEEFKNKMWSEKQAKKCKYFKKTCIVNHRKSEMQIWEYADGTVIRYRPAENSYSIEIRKKIHFPFSLDSIKSYTLLADIACKVDSAGNLIPKSVQDVVNPDELDDYKSALYPKLMMDKGHYYLAEAQKPGQDKQEIKRERRKKEEAGTRAGIGHGQPLNLLGATLAFFVGLGVLGIGFLHPLAMLLTIPYFLMTLSKFVVTYRLWQELPPGQQTWLKFVAAYNPQNGQVVDAFGNAMQEMPWVVQAHDLYAHRWVQGMANVVLKPFNRSIEQYDQAAEAGKKTIGYYFWHQVVCEIAAHVLDFAAIVPLLAQHINISPRRGALFKRMVRIIRQSGEILVFRIKPTDSSRAALVKTTSVKKTTMEESDSTCQAKIKVVSRKVAYSKAEVILGLQDLQRILQDQYLAQDKYLSQENLHPVNRKILRSVAHRIADDIANQAQLDRNLARKKYLEYLDLMARVVHSQSWLSPTDETSPTTERGLLQGDEYPSSYERDEINPINLERNLLAPIFAGEHRMLFRNIETLVHDLSSTLLTNMKGPYSRKKSEVFVSRRLPDVLGKNLRQLLGVPAPGKLLVVRKPGIGKYKTYFISEKDLAAGKLLGNILTYNQNVLENEKIRNIVIHGTHKITLAPALLKALQAQSINVYEIYNLNEILSPDIHMSTTAAVLVSNFANPLSRETTTRYLTNMRKSGGNIDSYTEWYLSLLLGETQLEHLNLTYSPNSQDVLKGQYIMRRSSRFLKQYIELKANLNTLPANTVLDRAVKKILIDRINENIGWLQSFTIRGPTREEALNHSRVSMAEYRTLLRHLVYLRWNILRRTPEKQKTRAKLIRRLEDKLNQWGKPMTRPGDEAWRQSSLLCSSGMATIETLLRFLAQVNEGSVAETQILFGTNSYYEIKKLDVIQTGGSLLIKKIDEQNTSEILTAIDTGRVRALLIDPISNAVASFGNQNKNIQVADFKTIITEMVAREYKQAFYFIIDTSLFGNTFQLEKYLNGLKIPKNFHFVMFSSLQKLHQTGLELTPGGILTLVSQDAKEHKVIFKLIRAFRDVLGLQPNLIEVLSLDAALGSEESVIFRTMRIMRNAQIFAEHIEREIFTGPDNLQVIHPALASHPDHTLWLENHSTGLPFVVLRLGRKRNSEFIKLFSDRLLEAGISVQARDSYGFSKLTYNYYFPGKADEAIRFALAPYNNGEMEIIKEAFSDAFKKLMADEGGFPAKEQPLNLLGATLAFFVGLGVLGIGFMHPLAMLLTIPYFLMNLSKFVVTYRLWRELPPGQQTWLKFVAAYNPKNGQVVDAFGNAMQEMPWVVQAHDLYAHRWVQGLLKLVGIDIRKFRPGTPAYLVFNIIISEVLAHSLDFLAAFWVLLARRDESSRTADRPNTLALLNSPLTALVVGGSAAVMMGPSEVATVWQTIRTRMSLRGFEEFSDRLVGRLVKIHSEVPKLSEFLKISQGVTGAYSWKQLTWQWALIVALMMNVAFVSLTAGVVKAESVQMGDVIQNNSARQINEIGRGWLEKNKQFSSVQRTQLNLMFRNGVEKTPSEVIRILEQTDPGIRKAAGGIASILEGVLGNASVHEKIVNNWGKIIKISRADAVPFTEVQILRHMVDGPAGLVPLIRKYYSDDSIETNRFYNELIRLPGELSEFQMSSMIKLMKMITKYHQVGLVKMRTIYQNRNSNRTWEIQWKKSLKAIERDNDIYSESLQEVLNSRAANPQLGIASRSILRAKQTISQCLITGQDPIPEMNFYIQEWFGIVWEYGFWRRGGQEAIFDLIQHAAGGDVEKALHYILKLNMNADIQGARIFDLAFKWPDQDSMLATIERNTEQVVERIFAEDRYLGYHGEYAGFAFERIFTRNERVGRTINRAALSFLNRNSLEYAYSIYLKAALVYSVETALDFFDEITPEQIMPMDLNHIMHVIHYEITAEQIMRIPTASLIALLCNGINEMNGRTFDLVMPEIKRRALGTNMSVLELVKETYQEDHMVLAFIHALNTFNELKVLSIEDIRNLIKMSTSSFVWTNLIHSFLLPDSFFENARYDNGKTIREYLIEVMLAERNKGNEETQRVIRGLLANSLWHGELPVQFENRVSEVIKKNNMGKLKQKLTENPVISEEMLRGPSLVFISPDHKAFYDKFISDYTRSAACQPGGYKLIKRSGNETYLERIGNSKQKIVVIYLDDQHLSDNRINMKSSLPELIRKHKAHRVLYKGHSYGRDVGRVFSGQAGEESEWQILFQIGSCRSRGELGREFFMQYPNGLFITQLGTGEGVINDLVHYLWLEEMFGGKREVAQIRKSMQKRLTRVVGEKGMLFPGDRVYEVIYIKQYADVGTDPAGQQPLNLLGAVLAFFVGLGMLGLGFLHPLAMLLTVPYFLMTLSKFVVTYRLWQELPPGQQTWLKFVAAYNPKNGQVVDAFGNAMQEMPWVVQAHDLYAHRWVQGLLKLVGIDIRKFRPGTPAYLVFNIIISEVLAHSLDFLAAFWVLLAHLAERTRAAVRLNIPVVGALPETTPDGVLDEVLRSFAGMLEKARGKEEIFSTLRTTILKHLGFRAVNVYDLRTEPQMEYRSLTREGMRHPSSAHDRFKSLGLGNEKAFLLESHVEERIAGVFEKTGDILHIEQRNHAPFVNQKELLRDIIVYSRAPRWLRAWGQYLAQSFWLPRPAARFLVWIIGRLCPAALARVNETLWIVVRDPQGEPAGLLLLNNWESGRPLFAAGNKSYQLAVLAVLGQQTLAAWQQDEKARQIRTSLQEVQTEVKQLNDAYEGRLVSAEMREAIHSLRSGLVPLGFLPRLIRSIPSTEAADKLRSVNKSLLAITGSMNEFLKAVHLADSAVCADNQDLQAESMRQRVADLQPDTTAPAVSLDQMLLAFSQSLLASENEEQVFSAARTALGQAAGKTGIAELIRQMTQTRLQQLTTAQFLRQEQEQLSLALDHLRGIGNLLEQTRQIRFSLLDMRRIIDTVRQEQLVAPEAERIPAADWTKALEYVDILLSLIHRVSVFEWTLKSVLRNQLPEVRPLDVAKGVNRAVVSARTLLPRLTLKLRINAEGPLVARVSPYKLEYTLVHEGLYNAFKYGASKVTVSVGHEGEEVVIHLRDNGRGLTLERLREIQSAITQDKALAPDPSVPTGMSRGIGLPEMARTLHLVGGSLEVASAGVDQGTTIAFRLPLASEEKAAEPQTFEAIQEALNSNTPGPRLLQLISKQRIFEAIPEIEGLETIRGGVAWENRDMLEFTRSLLKTLDHLKRLAAQPGAGPGKLGASWQALRQSASPQEALGDEQVQSWVNLYRRVAADPQREKLLWLVGLVLMSGKTDAELPEIRYLLTAITAQNIVAQYNRITGEALDERLAQKIVRYYALIGDYIMRELPPKAVADVFAREAFTSEDMALLALLSLAVIQNVGPRGRLNRTNLQTVLDTFTSLDSFHCSQQLIRESFADLRFQAWSLGEELPVPRTPVEAKNRSVEIQRAVEDLELKQDPGAYKSWRQFLNEVFFYHSYFLFNSLSPRALARLLYIVWQLGESSAARWVIFDTDRIPAGLQTNLETTSWQDLKQQLAQARQELDERQKTNLLGFTLSLHEDQLLARLLPGSRDRWVEDGQEDRKSRGGWLTVAPIRILLQTLGAVLAGVLFGFWIFQDPALSSLTVVGAAGGLSLAAVHLHRLLIRQRLAHSVLPVLTRKSLESQRETLLGYLEAQGGLPAAYRATDIRFDVLPQTGRLRWWQRMRLGQGAQVGKYYEVRVHPNANALSLPELALIIRHELWEAYTGSHARATWSELFYHWFGIAQRAFSPAAVSVHPAIPVPEMAVEPAARPLGLGRELTAEVLEVITEMQSTRTLVHRPNESLIPRISRVQSAFRYVLRSLAFRSGRAKIANLRQRMPLETTTGILSAGIAIFRTGLLLAIRLQPAQGIQIDSAQPELQRLLLENGLPDQTAVRLAAGRGLRLNTFHVAALNKDNRELLQGMERWIGGLRQETGQTILYVPEFLLASLLAGPPAGEMSALQRIGRQGQYQAYQYWLGLLVSRHAAAYQNQTRLDLVLSALQAQRDGQDAWPEFNLRAMTTTLRISRYLPSPIRSAVHAYWLRRNPTSYLNRTLGYDTSVLAQELRNPGSDVEQAYRLYSQVQNPATLRLWLSALAGFLRDQVPGLTHDQQFVALDTLARLTALPDLRARVVGRWLASARGPESRALVVPEIVLQPEQRKIWRVLRNILHPLPAVIDPQPEDIQPRRLRLTPGSAA